MKFLEKSAAFENFCFRGKHKPIDLSPSDPKLHNNLVREISFKYYRLSTCQIIYLHMHRLGLQVSVNNVSKVLKSKHNSLQCLCFNKQWPCKLASKLTVKSPITRTLPPGFPLLIKYCCAPNIAESLSSIHAYLLRHKKGQIFLSWLVKRWRLLFLIFRCKSDKSIIWFISLSYAYLRNGQELLQSVSSTPSPKLLIKLLGRQSCFPRPNQGLFHPTLTQNLISESRRLMLILAS